MAVTTRQVLEDFRQHLAEELGKYDRSQSALARHLGLNQSAVSRMISGDRRIRLEEKAPIEEYLAATDPSPPYLRASGLPSGLQTAPDPLAAYPDLARLAEQPADGQTWVEDVTAPDSDYPVVMTAGAVIEREVNRAILVLIKEGRATDDILGRGPRDNIAGKLSALEAAGVIEGNHAAAVSAALAIRDAFAHSERPLTLAHEPVLEVAKSVIQPSYFIAKELATQDPKKVRLLYLLGVIHLTHLLIVGDPAETAAMFLNMASAAWKARDTAD